MDVANSDFSAAMERLQASREPAAEPEPKKKPAPAAEPAETAEDRGPALSLDDAYDLIQDGKDRAQQESRAAAEPAPARPAQTDDSDGDAGPTWTTAEVERRDRLLEAQAAWQQDAAAFAKIKQQIDLVALEQQDKAKAVMVRQQLAEIEADLRRSHEAIEGEKQEFAGKVQGHRLKSEEAKLQRALPSLDKKALSTYLIGQAGFSKEEVAQAGDHRLVVLAEKARKWDEYQASQKGKKVPKLKAGTIRRATPAPTQSRVEKLRAKLEKSGSVDDALAVLRARRAIG